MREILFQGKRVEDGEWVDGYLVNHGEVYWIYTGEFDRLRVYKNGYGTSIHPPIKHLIRKETVCQYTGLKDSNGNKIFENDICDFTVFDHEDKDTQYRGVVVYCGSRFALWKSIESEYYGYDGGFDLDWVLLQDDEFKVIGNAFDNPRLLK